MSNKHITACGCHCNSADGTQQVFDEFRKVLDQERSFRRNRQLREAARDLLDGVESFEKFDDAVELVEDVALKLNTVIDGVQCGVKVFLQFGVEAESHNSSPVVVDAGRAGSVNPALTVQEGADIQSPGIGVAGACRCAAPAETSGGAL